MPLPAAPPAITPTHPGGQVLDPAFDPRRSDDDLIAYTLITMWALATGRTLPPGQTPDQLSAEDLIAFWADPALDLEVR